MNNIFVGNLSFAASKEDLRKLFESFGTVANTVIMERQRGKSRGYGFVDMPNEQEKNAALAALAGKEFMGRELTVSHVIPKARQHSKAKKFKPVQEKIYFREEEQGQKVSHREYGEKSREYREKPYRKNRSEKSWGRADAKPPRERPQQGKPYNKFKGQSKPSAWGKHNKDFQAFEGHKVKDERKSRRPEGREERSSNYRNPRQERSPERNSWQEGGERSRHSKPSFSWSHESEFKFGGKNKAPSKAPYKKFQGKSWPKKEGSSPHGGKPMGKGAGAFKKFFKAGRPSHSGKFNKD